MQNTFNLSRHAYGIVTPFYRRNIGGQIVDITLPSIKNTIVYEGADLLAQALVGDRVVSGMYFQFTNGTPNEVQVPPERRATYYHSTGSQAPKGFTRVPLLGRGEYTSMDVTRFNGNRIRMVAVSDDTVVIPDTGNEIQDNLTKFVGAALVSLATDYADDMLFSAVSFAFEDNVPVFIEKIPNAQIGLRWDIIFNSQSSPGGSSASSGSSSSS